MHYSPGSDGHLRPQLWLEVTGPRGGAPLPISGIVDTGADTTVLPQEYIAMLGYGMGDLAPTEIEQVEGHASAWVAQAPCQAVIVSGPEEPFELRPIFVPGALNVLWGRADFMAIFTVTLSERDKSFTLVLP